jgi:hypothetical protein
MQGKASSAEYPEGDTEGPDLFGGLSKKKL